MNIDPKAIGAAILKRRKEVGWSQERLAEATGTSQTTIDRIERGGFKRIPSVLPGIMRALNLRVSGIDLATAGSEDRSFTGERDLRVFSAAEGGPGELVVSTDPIELVPRPWYLKNVKEGFAVLVTGESMVPVFEPGDLAIVNPRLPPMRGKDVILVSDERDGEFRASIKRLLRWTIRDWYVQQFNPPPGQKSEFTLSRVAWPKALRVVGKYYGGG